MWRLPMPPMPATRNLTAQLSPKSMMVPGGQAGWIMPGGMQQVLGNASPTEIKAFTQWMATHQPKLMSYTPKQMAAALYQLQMKFPGIKEVLPFNAAKQGGQNILRPSAALSKMSTQGVITTPKALGPYLGGDPLAQTAGTLGGASLARIPPATVMDPAAKAAAASATATRMASPAAYGQSSAAATASRVGASLADRSVAFRSVPVQSAWKSGLKTAGRMLGPIILGLTLASYFIQYMDTLDLTGVKGAMHEKQKQLAVTGAGIMSGPMGVGMESPEATGEAALTSSLLPILAQRSQNIHAAALNRMSPGSPSSFLSPLNAASDEQMIGGSGGAGPSQADLIAMLQQGA